MVVIGGGVIGLEMGSVWRRLGAKVTVVEFLDRIVPGVDGEIATQFRTLLERQGMAFKLSTKVTASEVSGEGVKLTVEPSKGGAAETINADVVWSVSRPVLGPVFAVLCANALADPYYTLDYVFELQEVGVFAF